MGEVDVRLACIISGLCVEAGGSSVLKLDAASTNGRARGSRGILGISAFWWVLPVDCENSGTLGRRGGSCRGGEGAEEAWN